MALREVNAFREALAVFIEYDFVREASSAFGFLSEPEPSALMNRAENLQHRINALLDSCPESDTSQQSASFSTSVPKWELTAQQEWLSEVIDQLEEIMTL
jgi:hypothetical protein